MTECNYCYLDVDDGAVAHRDCELELFRRISARACLRCGKPAVPNRVRCGSCDVNARFSGFSRDMAD